MKKILKRSHKVVKQTKYKLKKVEKNLKYKMEMSLLLRKNVNQQEISVYSLLPLLFYFSYVFISELCIFDGILKCFSNTNFRTSEWKSYLRYQKKI